MIRTLQQRAVALGIDVFMECTVTELLKDGDRGSPGAFGYWRETGRFVVFEAPAVVLATGGIGKSFKVTSNSWEYTGDGHALALRAGADADQHGVRPVPPDRHGLAAVGAGHPGHRVRPRRRRHPEELRGQAVHVRLHPRVLQGGDGRHRGGGRPLVRGQEEQPPAARAAAARRGRPRDQLRGQGRPRQRRTAASSSTSPRAVRRSTSASGCRRCTTSSRSWPTSTSPQEPMEVGPDLPLRDGRRRGRRRHRGERVPGPLRRRRGAPAACTAPTGSAATRCPTCWSSAGAPATARRGVRRAASAARGRGRRRGDVEAAAGAALAPFERHGAGREPVHDPAGPPADDERPGRHHPHRGGAGAGRSSEIEKLKERAQAPRRSRATGSTTPAGTSRSTCATCCSSRECIAKAALEREESRGGHTRDDYPGPDAGVGHDEPRADARRRGRRRRPGRRSRCR